MKRNKLNRKFRRNLIVSLMTLSVIQGMSPIEYAVEPEKPEEPKYMTNEKIAEEIKELEEKVEKKHENEACKRWNKQLRDIVVDFYKAFKVADDEKKDEDGKKKKVIEEYVETTKKICKMLGVSEITDLYANQNKFFEKFGEVLTDVRSVEEWIRERKIENGDILFGSSTYGNVKVGTTGTSGPRVVAAIPQPGVPLPPGVPQPPGIPVPPGVPQPPGIPMPGAPAGVSKTTNQKTKDKYVKMGAIDLTPQDLRVNETAFQRTMRERPSSKLYDDDLLETLETMPLKTKKRLWDLKVEQYRRDEESWMKKKSSVTYDYLKNHVRRTEVEAYYERDSKKQFISNYERDSIIFSNTVDEFKNFFDVTGTALTSVERRIRAVLSQKLQAYKLGGGLTGMPQGNWSGELQFDIPANSEFKKNKYNLKEYCIIPSVVYEIFINKMEREKPGLKKVALEKEKEKVRTDVEKHIKGLLDKANFSGFSGKIIIKSYDNSCKNEDQGGNNESPFRGIFVADLIVDYNTVGLLGGDVDNPLLENLTIVKKTLKIPTLLGRWGAPDVGDSNSLKAQDDLVIKFFATGEPKDIYDLKKYLLGYYADSKKSFKQKNDEIKFYEGANVQQNKNTIKAVVSEVQRKFSPGVEKKEPYWAETEKWKQNKKTGIKKFTNSNIESCLPEARFRPLMVRQYNTPDKYAYDMVSSALKKVRTKGIEKLFKDGKFNKNEGNISDGGSTFREYFGIKEDEEIDLNKIRFHFGPTSNDIGFYYGEIKPEDAPFYAHLIVEELENNNKNELAEDNELYANVELNSKLDKEIANFKSNTKAYGNGSPFTYNIALQKRMERAAEVAGQNKTYYNSQINKLLKGRQPDKLKGAEKNDYETLKEKHTQSAFNEYAAKKFSDNSGKINSVIVKLDQYNKNNTLKNQEVRFEDNTTQMIMTYGDLEKYKQNFCDFLMNTDTLTLKEEYSKNIQEQNKKQKKERLEKIKNVLTQKLSSLNKHGVDTDEIVELSVDRDTSDLSMILMDFVDSIENDIFDEYSNSKENGLEKENEEIFNQFSELIQQVHSHKVIHSWKNTVANDRIGWIIHHSLYKRLLDKIDDLIRNNLSAELKNVNKPKESQNIPTKTKKQLLDETLKNKFGIDAKKLNTVIKQDVEKMLGIDEQFDANKSEYQQYKTSMEKNGHETLGFADWMEVKKGKKLDTEKVEKEKLALEYAQYLFEHSNDPNKMSEDDYKNNKEKKKADAKKEYESKFDEYKKDNEDRLKKEWEEYTKNRISHLNDDEWMRMKHLEEFIIQNSQEAPDEMVKLHTELTDLKKKDEFLRDLEYKRKMKRIQNAYQNYTKAKQQKKKKEFQEFYANKGGKNQEVLDWIKSQKNQKNFDPHEEMPKYLDYIDSIKKGRIRPDDTDLWRVKRFKNMADKETEISDGFAEEIDKPLYKLAEQVDSLKKDTMIKALKKQHEADKKIKESKDRLKKRAEEQIDRINKSLKKAIDSLNQPTLEEPTLEEPAVEKPKVEMTDAFTNTDSEKDTSKEKLDSSRSSTSTKDSDTGKSSSSESSSSDKEVSAFDKHMDEIYDYEQYLEGKVASLEDKNKELENKLAEKNKDLESKNQEISDQNKTIESQNEEIAELKKQNQKATIMAGTTGTATAGIAGLGLAAATTETGKTIARKALEKIAPKLTRDIAARIAAKAIADAGANATKEVAAEVVTNTGEKIAQKTITNIAANALKNGVEGLAR